MTDSAPPEDASPPDPVAKPAASRWAKLWGQLKRFRWTIAVAAVVVLALVALALVQLPTVWQTIVTIAGVGAVLSGLAGYWNTYHTVKRSVPLAAPPSKAPVAVRALSVMVLPFQNLTGDAGQAYVADGLTANQTADLSRIRDAFIVDAATAFTYKDKSVTAQQVGKDLGVRFVLQGSVQRNGTKIRINAQLADANSNAQLWSESFDGDQSDLFALQDRVTTLVGNSIGREMVILAARESETRKSSPTVADLMLRARALFLEPTSIEILQQSEDLNREILALEPNNTNAMIDLAASLVLQAANYPGRLDERVKEKKFIEGRDLALKAKNLNPNNPRVYAPIQIYATEHDDYEGALRAAESQLALLPRSSTAHNNLGVVFYFGGEPKRSIDLLTQAIDLDPRHPMEEALYGMCRAHFMLGDDDAAIEWGWRTLEKHPIWPAWTYAHLAMAYAGKGEDAKARAAAAEACRLDPNNELPTLLDVPASYPAAYKRFHGDRLVPAWRKAGLPE